MRCTVSEKEIQFRILKKEGISLYLLNLARNVYIYAYVLSSRDVA